MTDRDHQPGAPEPWPVKVPRPGLIGAALPTPQERQAGKLGVADCRATLRKARPPAPVKFGIR